MENEAVAPYLLFAGDTYYPGEGIDDLVCAGTDVGSLVEVAKSQDIYMGWFQIVRRSDMAIVARGMLGSMEDRVE